MTPTSPTPIASLHPDHSIAPSAARRQLHAHLQPRPGHSPASDPPPLPKPQPKAEPKPQSSQPSFIPTLVQPQAQPLFSSLPLPGMGPPFLLPSSILHATYLPVLLPPPFYNLVMYLHEGYLSMFQLTSSLTTSSLEKLNHTW